MLEDNTMPSTAQRFAQAFGAAGQAAGQGIPQYLMGQQAQKKKLADEEQTIQALQKMTGQDFSGIKDPDERKALAVQFLKNMSKENLYGKKQDFLSQILGNKQPQQMNQGNVDPTREMMQNPQGLPQQQGQQQGGFDPSQLSDAEIAQATAIDPQLGRLLQDQKRLAFDQRMDLEKRDRTLHEGDRSYHTQFSKAEEDKANNIRENLTRKNNALSYARNAIETGNVSYFSPDKLADATGMDLFRTAKGAQLSTAGKENLLSNMSRVSSRGQNMWFEQRLNSMFPKIGQDREANLTVQEMLEGETAMESAYLREFDRLANDDQERYGYVKKDISQRARNAVKPYEKEIMKRTSFRMKEVEEQEMGERRLKNMVGKNVIKGTPLTRQMAKLYAEKYGDKALQVAEKAGYYVPTFEEYQEFKMRPGEYGETNNL